MQITIYMSCVQKAVNQRLRLHTHYQHLKGGHEVSSKVIFLIDFPYNWTFLQPYADKESMYKTLPHWLHFQMWKQCSFWLVRLQAKPWHDCGSFNPEVWHITVAVAYVCNIKLIKNYVFCSLVHGSGRISYSASLNLSCINTPKWVIHNCRLNS